MTSSDYGEGSELPRHRVADQVRFTTGFIGLLLLGLAWPNPLEWVNDATLDLPLAVNERSFLGREAPAVDVAYWFLAGLFVLTSIQGKTRSIRSSWSTLSHELRTFPMRAARAASTLSLLSTTLVIALAAASVSLVWIIVDEPFIAAATQLRSVPLDSIVRYGNRLGGGMNPAMVVIFLLLGGMIQESRRLIRLALAMVAAGLFGGAFVHLLKLAVGRTRPELWMGAFHHTGPEASSFPSGHTFGAFAIATVIAFGCRGVALRSFAVFMAMVIGLSRVLAFRHWPSDVYAAALVGVLTGWFFIRAVQMKESS